MSVGDGDDARAWGPPWVGNESCYFLSVNRNKKAIIAPLLPFLKIIEYYERNGFTMRFIIIF